MTSTHSKEVPSQRPNPQELLTKLQSAGADQAKFNHLRELFIDEAEVDEYVDYLDTDEEIDLTKKQLNALKGTLASFKVYLQDYLKQAKERIGRFDDRLKKSAEAFADPDLEPEDVKRIAHTRTRVAKAMQIAKAPRGQNGKSLREVTQGESSGKAELSPERIDQWLTELKSRFDLFEGLHKNVKWEDVEKSLRANTEAMGKLIALDDEGHAMNVFGEVKGEFIFASGWNDYEQVSPKHRNIAFDKEGQKLAEQYGYKPKGNATDIASGIGVDLADPELHQQLRKAIDVRGWAWLKTDAATRKAGGAFGGYSDGIYEYNANNCNGLGSFRAALRVKKA